MPHAELISFRRRWVLLNTVTLLTAYVLYTPIAHGFTGAHASRQLTSAQFVAHSIALVLVAVLVAAAQRRALSKFALMPLSRLVVAALAFPVAFWLGYYQPWINGPDTDILAGFLVLGSAVWIGNVPAKRHPIAATIAILSFPFASFVAELCLLIVFTGLQITPALQTNRTLTAAISDAAATSIKGIVISRARGSADSQGSEPPNTACSRRRSVES